MCSTLRSYENWQQPSLNPSACNPYADTEAQQSVIGVRKAEEYCKLQKFNFEEAHPQHASDSIAEAANHYLLWISVLQCLTERS